MSKEELEWKPYPCKVNGEERLLVRNNEQRVEWRKQYPRMNAQKIGLLALALFWEKSEVDYIAVSTIAENGDESWTRMFEMYEMLDWMAGFTLPYNFARQKDLQRIHRNAYEFSSEYGWRPDVVIEWGPSEQEEEVYLDYLMSKDENNTGNLLIPPDWGASGS